MMAFSYSLLVVKLLNLKEGKLRAFYNLYLIVIIGDAYHICMLIYLLYVILNTCTIGKGML